MSIIEPPEVPPSEQAHSSLADGLKSCRAVIRNYRSLLTMGLDRDAAPRRAIPLDPENPATGPANPPGDS